MFLTRRICIALLTIINVLFLSCASRVQNPSEKTLKSFHGMEDSFKEQEKLNTVAYPENPNIKQRFLQSKTKKILSIIDSVKNEFILKSTSSDDRLTIMGTALFFRKSMEDYHNEMKSYFIGSDSLIEESFGFKDIQQGNKVIPWEEAYLLKSPLAGIVTLLSKIKTDIILLEKSLFEEYT